MGATASAALAVAALYLGREVLVPMALAGLLSFILTHWFRGCKESASAHAPPLRR